MRPQAKILSQKASANNERCKGISSESRGWVNKLAGASAIEDGRRKSKSGVLPFYDVPALR
jgi:hypothetical protein